MQLGVLEYLISVNDKGVQEGINHSEATIKKSAAKAEKNLKEYGNKISAWTIAKGQMIANATTKIVKTFASTTKQLVTSSVKAVADYEQLVGGVETLFKGASVQVQKFAEQAYKTAGISANEYMETVTSFSASLLQSLENDTDKAADYADMAIRDMADNANKMGSSMESIQNAYQGFAKQNYTMLDNLKLGYGGTKTEMERLLKDAGKLTNRTFNISKLSDVYEAIHIIQQEMGIYGTTEKEAAETISGSLNTAKAAWKDLLVAIGNGRDVKQATKKFTDSAKTMIKNIVPVAKTAIKNIFVAAKEALPDIKSAIGEIWGELKKDLPKNGFISKIYEKVEGILGLFQLMSDLMSDFDGTTDNLVKSQDPLLRGFGKIAMLADKLIGDIGEGIEESGSLLFGMLGGIGTFVGDLLTEFSNWISDPKNTEKITNTITQLITGLASAITAVAKPIADALIQVLNDPGFQGAITQIAVTLANTIWTLIQNGPDALKVAAGVAAGKKALDVFGWFKNVTGGGSASSGGGLGTTLGGLAKTALTKAGSFLLGGAGTPLTVLAAALGIPLMAQGQYTDKWRQEQQTRKDKAAQLREAGYTEEADFIEEAANALGLSLDENGNEKKNVAGQSYTQYTADHDALLQGLKTNTYMRTQVMRYFKQNGIAVAGNYAHTMLNDYLNGVGFDLGEVDSLLGAVTDALVAMEGKYIPEETFFSKDTEQRYAYMKQFFNKTEDEDKNLDDSAGKLSDAADSITQAAGQLPDALSNANVNVSLFSSFGSLFNKNAKGNWSVPYDNFPALLHRDEMVLTKSQARQFRDGTTGGTDGGMGDAIAAAVEKAMSRVYVMMSGEKVGDLTTRRIRNNLNASSYSKLRAYGG